jgi:hypothetical protein
LFIKGIAYLSGLTPVEARTNALESLPVDAALLVTARVERDKLYVPVRKPPERSVL